MAVIPLKPKALLFDLGGVIVPWVGLEALAELNDITREEVSNRFNNSTIFQAFERGLASEADFVTELAGLFNLPDTDVSALWNSWVKPPYPGTLATLKNLKKRFTIACLSNTNSLHWAHLNTLFNLEDTFHFAFASHEIQDAKPNAASYLKPIQNMGCAIEDVWFFDDTLANIEGARHVGLTAFHVNREVGVIPILENLQLLN